MTARVRDALHRYGIELKTARYGENRGACPKCNRKAKDTALAVSINGNCAVWTCHRCQWSGAVSPHGRQRTVPATPPATSHVRDHGHKLEVAAQLWRESVPLAGTLGEIYLRARGCPLPSPDADLRFHPRAMYWAEQRTLPALVCRVSTVRANCWAGVHRIYLDPSGGEKAVAKLRLGSCDDEPVCIRLTVDDEVTTVLAIAEGVETALAAARIARVPTWATIDSGGMARFPVLAGVDTLTIFADHDKAGILSAGACTDRWRAAGRTVIAVAPRRRGADVNDLVREAGHG